MILTSDEQIIKQEEVFLESIKLFDRITDVSNHIHERSKGRANVLVLPASLATLFQN